jgi:HemY protein
MVKIIISLLLLVIAVLLTALFIQKDPSYVLVQYNDFSLETRISVGIVALFIWSVLFLIVIRLLLSILRMPRSMKKQSQHRRVEKSRRLLSQGLMDLAEGRFAQAESSLIKLIDYTENPLLNYLAAARAAQQLGKHDARDNYLKAAHEARPEAEVAIGVTQAELQLASSQTERALATLTHLKTLAPKHDYVTKLLARVYFQLEEWTELLELLPDLRRKKLFREDRLKEIEMRTYVGAMEDSAQQSTALLEKTWSILPKDYQTDADLVLRYIELRGQDKKESKAIEQTIVKSVNKQWDANLVDYYGRMVMEDTTNQLNTAEKWLTDYGSSDTLLLALGRICIRLKLWGKAQNYLEASVGLKPSAENCLELADLYKRDELGETEKACRYYEQGLSISLNKSK